MIRKKSGLQTSGMRRAIERAKRGGNTEEMLGGGIIEERVTEEISRANSEIRGGEYGIAIKILERAYKHSSRLPDELREKYDHAIIKRLKRIEDKVGNSSSLYNLAFDLAMKIQGDPFMQRSLRMDLRDYVKSFLGIVGIVVGLFFLSSNLTGNVIGNLTQNSTNWVGGILAALGVILVLSCSLRK